jgi:PAS domain S-box-containing protein
LEGPAGTLKRRPDVADDKGGAAAGLGTAGLLATLRRAESPAEKPTQEPSLSQSLLQAVVDNTDNAILVLDANRRVVFYNRLFSRMWEFSPEFLDSGPTMEELLRDACDRGLYPPEQADELIRRRLELLHGREPRTVIDTPRLDGIIVEGYATALPDGGYLLTYRDVTQRRTAEDAIRQQMEFTRNLLQSLPVATFVVDRDHLVRFWNRACEELTGIAAADMVGTDEQWKPFYPSPRPCLADLVLRGESHRLAELYPVWGGSRLGAEALHAEGWYERLGGRRRYIVFDAAPIRGAGGEIVAAVETIQDFTAHQRAKEELAFLARAVDQAVEAVFIADVNFRVQYVNPAGQRVTGHDLQEFLGRDLRRVLEQGQEEHFAEQLEQAIGRAQAWSGTMRHRHKDGSWRQAEFSLSPLCDEGGAVINWVALLHDVTRQADLEHHLALSQKLTAIGTLAGGIAHDFNNLLTAILGYAEMAQDAVEPGGPAARDLDRVLQAGERARDLVAQILAFSRQESQVRRPVALADLVEETLDFLAASTPSSVELRGPVRKPDYVVFGDPTQLQQVILNLCTNAVQAVGDRAGRVEVTLEAREVGRAEDGPLHRLEPGSYVVLRVADTGCGVPPEVLSRIFDPFFTTKAVGQGTGMGLSVVHGVVSAHGGCVEAQSIPGRGSRFSVYLPRVETGAEEDAVCPRAATLSGCGRVLVVDDDPLVAELLEDMLEGLGYECRAAPGGAEALELLRSDPTWFDLLVTDRAMPRVTGEDLAREALVLRPDLPVILVTGFSDAPARERLEALGVREVIQKPIRRSQLAEALGRVLGPGEPATERG